MELLPTYLVRLSGFSFARLEKFQFTETLATIRAGAGVRAAVRAEMERLAAALGTAPKRVQRAVRRVLQVDGELELLEDSALQAVAASLPELHRIFREGRDRFEEAFASDLQRARDHLRAEFEHDARLREAVFLESPSAYAALGRLKSTPRNVQAKRNEATAVMYLQRFCAKNDTNSMCGPVAIARFFTDARAGTIRIVEELAHRKTYFSHWAACLVRNDDQFVRLNPTARLDGASLHFCRIEHDATTFMRRAYRQLHLEGPLEALCAAAVGARKRGELIAEIAEKSGADEDELEGLLDALVESGALLPGSLPFGLFDTLQGASEALTELIHTFATGDLETRATSLVELEATFENLTGKSARRAAGRHYADRGLLHEDCVAEADAALGTETSAPLLAGLDALSRAVVLPMERVRAGVLAWFRDLFGEERFVSALEVHRAFDRDRPHEQNGTSSAIENVRGIIADAVRDRVDHRAHVDRAALIAAAGALRPGYASADVMMLPPGEAIRFVVGEMHGFFMVPTLWFDVARPEIRERALADLKTALGRLAGGVETADAILEPTQASDRRFPIADVDLEIIGRSPRSGAVLFGEIDVGINEGRLQFRRRGGREILPFAADSTYPFLGYLSPLAPLVDDFRGKFFPSELLPDSIRESDAPALVLDDIVFRRATWVRTAKELRAHLEARRDCDLFVRAQRLRERLGCPRYVFASMDGEPKPILVDFENFLLLESFMKRVCALPEESKVRWSEMLPGPEHLFLQGADGPRTFELRIGLYQYGP